jgi:hypothetical protein
MLADRVKKWRKEWNRNGTPAWERMATGLILEMRFGPIPPKYKIRFETADKNTLLTWAERATTVELLEDVFANG